MALPQIIYTTSAKLNTIAVKDGQIIFVKDSKLLYVDMDTTRVKVNSSSTGATGIKGDTGTAGATGASGTAATIAIGTVSVGAVGGNATVTNSGSNSAATLNFTIPKGADGAKGPTGDKGNTGSNGSNGTNASIAVGTVTTGNTGTNAVITNAGNTTAAKYNFTIPRGATGDTGPKGDKGATGSAGTAGKNGTAATITVGTVTSGTTASVTNVGTTSAAKLNFVLPKGATGAKGDTGATGDKGDIGPQGDSNTINFAEYTLKGDVADTNVIITLYVEYTNDYDIIQMSFYVDCMESFNFGIPVFMYTGETVLYKCAHKYGCSKFKKSGHFKTGIMLTNDTWMAQDSYSIEADYKSLRLNFEMPNYDEVSKDNFICM